jgi:hypothetical protein
MAKPTPVSFCTTTTGTTMTATHDLTYSTGFDPRPRPATTRQLSIPLRTIVLVALAAAVVFSPWFALRWLGAGHQAAPTMCSRSGGDVPTLHDSLAGRRAAIEALEAGEDGPCR